jgi:hypothetical protein
VAAYSTAKARAAPARTCSRGTGSAAASVATVRRPAAKDALIVTFASDGSKTTVAAARLIDPATGAPCSMSARPALVSSAAVTT